MFWRRNRRKVEGALPYTPIRQGEWVCLNMKYHLPGYPPADIRSTRAARFLWGPNMYIRTKGGLAHACWPSSRSTCSFKDFTADIARKDEEYLRQSS